MPAFCPLCASDEHTEEDRTSDGVRYATCTHRSHGSEPYVWEPYDPAATRKSTGRPAEGLGAELEIWEKLLACLDPGGDPIPYGDLEDRFLERYPAEWAMLIDRYGHKWRYPERSPGYYTVSVYLAARLRELADEGDVELTWGPATGPWSYNGIISHWRLEQGV